jgi:DNA-binding transcriptional LysR family regulator
LPLAKLPLPEPVPVRRMGLLWAARAPHAQLARLFLECARAELGLTSEVD